MSKNTNKESLLYFDPKIERTVRRRFQQARAYKAGENLRDNLKKEVEEFTMDPNNNNAVNVNVANPNTDGEPKRTLGSYTAPNPYFYGNSIVVTHVAANNFELKPQLISLVQQNFQFHRLPQGDPSLFISNFLQICDIVKTIGVNPDVYKLLLFPFAKLIKLRTDVQTFRQKEGESLYEAWERYNLMLGKCPPDMFSNWIQLQIFYDEISETARMSLDNSVGGSLHMKKTPNEAMKLIEMVANNQYLYSSKRTSVKKGIMELDTLDAILAHNKSMSQQINAITQHFSGMQVSAISTQDTSYDMSGGFSQGGTGMKNKLTNPSLQGSLTEVKQSLQLKPPLVGVNTIFPNIKPKFGIGCASSTKEEGPKKKVLRSWRNKKIPSKDFSPGTKVVFIESPILPHTVNKILSLEHIELIHERTGKRFTVRGEELRPYDHPSL
ncbi:hypothetical protein AHAS_Ahas03G0171300 [Arachis hypogaea]